MSYHPSIPPSPHPLTLFPHNQSLGITLLISILDFIAGIITTGGLNYTCSHWTGTTQACQDTLEYYGANMTTIVEGGAFAWVAFVVWVVYGVVQVRKYKFIQ